ncbi:MAG TPA: arylsulfotransferase family protein [Solirubrobacteraceae bacterium]|nr:arylsulfotransferase family protein [Solirubrobacteraceae bacterium]
MTVIAAAVVAVIAASGPTVAPTVVDVFPIPGGHVALPGTQITFRGVPVNALGRIMVTGSESGVHTGVVLADSDGHGGSFVPDQPFQAGEQVTVQTGLSIAGVRRGTFRFTVASPAGAIPAGAHAPIARTAGDVWHFVSRPDLAPAAVRVDRRSSAAAPGDVFVASQSGPVQNGPELLGADGGLIYFKPVPPGESATDFRTQTYQGKPVLTWWQGSVSSAGVGAGEDEIYDSSYRPVAIVKAGNGLAADLHEFQLTSRGTALITAEVPVYWNASSATGASSREIVLDAVVQEIDVRTGLVLYQWDSLDHVPVTASYQPPPADTGHPWDYFHVNSIEPLPDGSLLVSSRDTWAVYKISRATGAVQWTLGGKHSSFTMGANTRFAFQHDARLHPGDELTIFDDGAGPPLVHQQSRALTLKLDTPKMTATVARQAEHDPPLSAAYEGNVQRLPNGDDFVGWGQQPYVTEFDPAGATVFDARFVGATDTYRAYRFAWSGTPVTQPAAKLTTSAGHATVCASWNGTTSTARWRVLAGPSASSLRPAATVAKSGFETAIPLPAAAADVEVQALDAHGNVLATSRIVGG